MSVPVKPKPKKEVNPSLFTKVPHALWQDRKLSDRVKVLMIAFIEFQGRNDYAWPSHQALADRLGWKVWKVKVVITEAVEAGVLEHIEPDPYERMRKFGSNEYRVKIPLGGKPTSRDTDPSTSRKTSRSRSVLADAELDALETDSQKQTQGRRRRSSSDKVKGIEPPEDSAGPPALLTEEERAENDRIIAEAFPGYRPQRGTR